MQVKKCIALLLFTMCIKDARRILSWYMSGYTNISCKRDVLCVSVDRGFRSKTKMMVEKWLNFTEKNRDKFHFVHCFFFWRCGPRRAMASSFTWFLDHAQSRTITHIHAQSRTFTHNHAPHLVGSLWKLDQLVAETSTWQHTCTTVTRERQPCYWRYSNPQSQQACGLRPTP